jgi:hypothetical protein
MNTSATNTIDANVVSANGASGVGVVSPASATGNLIRRNLIGTDVTGLAPLGNGAHGIYLLVGAGAGTVINIGGGAGLGNTIAFNDGNGIQVNLPAGGVQTIISFNTIRNNDRGIQVSSGTASVTRNSIDQNDNLGIDLGPVGVTPNDPLDADTGPNGLQNFPVLTSVTPSIGSYIINGTLASAALGSYTLEFYASPQCDPTGFGEGAIVIGATNVVTNPLGNGAFALPINGSLPGGYFVSAFARPSGGVGGTSELAQCVEYINTPAGSDVSVTPVDVATGGTPIELTFDDVTGSGNTLLTLSDTGPPPPGAFTFGDNATFYDLSTTATFTGSIEVCITYDEASLPGAESDLKLLHYDESVPGWVDITTSLDTDANILCGQATSLSSFGIAVTVPTGIGDDGPGTFALHPCAPNPFNPITTIRYDVPQGGARVAIVVYDVAGRRIRTLVDGVQPAGKLSVVWDGRNQAGQGVASGVYFYRMSAGGFVQTRKMVLLK